MGGKSKAPTQQVPDYRMDLHLSICQGPVDYIRRIIMADKDAWIGVSRQNESLGINNIGLFGGRKKEGGPVGQVLTMFGRADQLCTDLMASKFNRTPATMPGFRGFASLFFTENQTDFNAGARGFLWRTNTPRLPETYVEVTAIPVSLNRLFAAIQRGKRRKKSLYFSLDYSGSMADSGRLAAQKTAVNNALAVLRSDIRAGVEIDVGVSRYSTATTTLEFSNATVANIDALIAFVSAGTAGGDTNMNVMAADAVAWFNQSQAESAIGYRGWFISSDGNPTGDTDIAGATLAADLIDQGSGEFSRDAGTAVDIVTVNIDLADTVAAARFDNSAIDAVPVIPSGDQDAFEEVLGRFLFPLSEAYDCNPAHILWEVFTQGPSAQAESLYDRASFEAAAETLYEEGLGLSFVWNKPTSVRQFSSEIEAHIQGQVFLHPNTGLMTLRLLRQDYNLADLPVMDEINSERVKLVRRALGDTVNSIDVTWTDPINEQEATTPAVQDVANIVAQGRVATDTRDFYGVRDRDLAIKLGYRELVAASRPLANAQYNCSRAFWDLAPGDAVRLTDTEIGISQLVMRVTKVTRGTPGKRLMSVEMIEDAFGNDDAVFELAEETLHEDQSETPTNVAHAQFFTLPYYIAANEIANVSGIENPDVFVGILAAPQGLDTAEYALLGESIDPLGASFFEEIGDNDVVGRSVLVADLGAEASSTGLALGPFTRGGAPVPGSLLFIGEGGDAATEMALVTAADPGGQGYDLSRGVLDTTPKDWPAGTPVWALVRGNVIADQTVRAAGVEVDYKLLPVTSRGRLPEASADLYSFNPTLRPYLPSRPANVRVNNQGFGLQDLSGAASAEVTFATRNRVTEEVVIVGWTESNVTPETGQTVTVAAIGPDGATILTENDGVTSPYQMDLSDFGGEAYGFVRVTAKRDGLESLQGHLIPVLAADAILAENAFPLLLESGSAMLIE